MTRNDPIKHVFIWPALLIVLVISIFPLIYSLTTSFMSLRLVPPIPPRFVGFGNYAELLQNPRFWHVAWTTSVIAFICGRLAICHRLRGGVGAQRQSSRGGHLSCRFSVADARGAGCRSIDRASDSQSDDGSTQRIHDRPRVPEPSVPYADEMGDRRDHLGRGVAMDAVRHPDAAGRDCRRCRMMSTRRRRLRMPARGSSSGASRFR